MDKVMSKAYDSIAQERRAQDAHWGGPVHNDLCDVYDWEQYLSTQIDKLLCDSLNPSVLRDRFVKIAALAVAAIDSLDRKYP
jgi:hypothetical protein